MNCRAAHFSMSMAIALVLLALASSPLKSQTTAPRTQPAAVASGDPWKARLESLRPDDPQAYFELAEELADAATTDQHRSTARHLFALAGVLDSRRLGRSACLALAEMESSPQQKRRLEALAALLDPSGASIVTSLGVVDRTAPTIDLPAIVAVCEALSRYRRGQGSQALALLKKPGAMDVLQAHASLLPMSVSQFLDDCKQLRGSKPPLSDDAINQLLRLESLLLTGAERSWATELALHNKSQPLLEIDPDHLEETFGIDGRRPIHRNGRWVER